MKRVIYIIASLFCYHFAFSQPQRLAVIPGALDKLQTICIDYFAEIPSIKDNLSKIIELGEGSSGELEKINFTGTGKYNTVHAVPSSPGAKIDRPFLIGTDDALGEVSKHYAGFIKERIAHYRGMGMNTHLASLQTDVWCYDVLKHLGYLHENTDPLSDFLRAKHAFSSDFGTVEAKVLNEKILSTGEQIKYISKVSESSPTGYRFLYVVKNRNSSQFTVFDKLSSPIYRGSDKRQLCDVLSSYQDEDNINFLFEGYAENSKEAFMTDFRIGMKGKQGKKIYTSRYDEVLFSDGLHHRIISSDQLKETIETINIKDKTWYSASVLIESGNPKITETARSVIITASSHRNAVVLALTQIHGTFSNKLKKFNLSRSLSSVKRYVVRSANISQDDIIMYLENSVSASRITKSAGSLQYLITQQ